MLLRIIIMDHRPDLRDIDSLGFITDILMHRILPVVSLQRFKCDKRSAAHPPAVKPEDHFHRTVCRLCCEFCLSLDLIPLLV